MTVEVQGIAYLTVAELLKELGVTRQTLWRWRQDGVIPQGRRFRGRQILFNEQEVSAIHSYANRIEAIEPSGSEQQLKLFSSAGHR